MLQLGGRTITVDGITVYPDHADPDQFWFLPGPVQLTRDDEGQAAFTFIKYKPAAVSGGAKGGGFLTFSVDLTLTAQLERRILGQLRRFSRKPRLAPAPFDEGTVQVIALDLQGSGGTTAEAAQGGFRAVEKILGATVPSLAGDNTAAFSLTLSQEGATILEQAFEEGTQPVGVIYDLKYTGMRPALHVEIEADLERVYNQFSASLEAQVYFVRAGIDAAFEKLVQDGAIKIKVLNFTGEADQDTKEQWALDFFKNDLLSEWFTPTLTPGQIAGNMPQADGLDQVRALGNALRPPTTPAPPRPGATPAPAAAGAHATPNPAAGTGQGDEDSGTLNVRPAEGAGGNPTAGSGFPRASTEAPTPAATGVQVPATPAGAGAAGAASPAVVSFKLRFVRQEERKHLKLTYDRASATQRTYAPQGFFGLLAADLDRDKHFVEVDLDDPFFRAFRVAIEAPFDFARIGLGSVHLALDYGDDDDPATRKHADFIFRGTEGEQQQFEAFMSPALETSYTYTVQYHFDPDSDWEGERFSYEMRPVRTEDRTLLINPHEDLAFLDIAVEATQVDWAVVESIEVELAHSDRLGNRDRTLLITQQSPTAAWKLRVEDHQAREYSYSLVHHLHDGTTSRTEPITTRATKVPVTDPFPGRLEIEFIPLLSAADTRMAFVDLQYEDAANNYHREERLELAPDALDPVPVSLALMDPKANAFRYRVTLIGNDNSVERGPFIETTETLIAVSETAIVVE